MKLRNNSDDSRYLFRKDSWAKDIYIAWSKTHKKYKFVKITREEIYECKQQKNILTTVRSRLNGVYNNSGATCEFKYFNMITGANNLGIETNKNKTNKENSMSK